ncbi:MAG TPA: hypothetical protein VMF89_28625 [Polyangiales bacterium]|nr:hypothetical protein [Polyangiales bacterium]
MTASQRWLWALVLAGLSANGACTREQDCNLYGTCPGSLLERADTLAGENAPGCRQCLDEHCRETALSCALNIECNFTSRCMLTNQLSDYQSCVRDLYEGGFTFGDERRYPWEGRNHTFATCLHDNCRAECIGDPFACGETYDNYEDLRLRVAVRSYPDYEPLRRIKLKACIDPEVTNRSGGITCIEPEAETDDRGIASFDGFGEDLRMEELFFEIAPSRGDFPKTLYFPGRLGKSDLQLLTIYVVKTFLIERGNDALGRGHRVLGDRAQSLILTDSCVWEKISVPDLSIYVKDSDLALCRAEPCDGPDCKPCVWYARHEFPDREAEKTDGTGAGIVGLDSGLYTIVVERPGEVIAERTIRMKPGAMTIARTWPMKKSARPKPRGQASATPPAGAP